MFTFAIPWKLPGIGPWSLQRYIKEIEDGETHDVVSALEYWQCRKAVYPRLSVIAEDLVCAPASEAFVERIYFCGRHVVERQKESHGQIFRNASLSEIKLQISGYVIVYVIVV